MVFAAICGCVLVSRGAHAEPRAQASFSLYGSWLPRLPAVRTSTAFTWLRSVAPTELSPVGASLFGGGAFDVKCALDDRWFIPLLGVGVGAQMAPMGSVFGGADGSVVELQPWTAIQVLILGPGWGVRKKERRWMWSAVVRTGASFVSMKALIGTGADALFVNASRWEPLLRGEAEFCRRFDPTSRLCVFVAPHLYESGWANGGSAGVSWELGP